MTKKPKIVGELFGFPIVETKTPAKPSCLTRFTITIICDRDETKPYIPPCWILQSFIKDDSHG